jgi:hypothetical protein
MIAMMVVTLIALTVAAILQTAAYGTSSQREVRRVVVRSEQVQTRIEDAIRDARAVLGFGSGYVVLWTGDTNPDGQVNRSELQLIELPAASTTLTLYTGQYASGEPAYAASSNFSTVAQSIKSSGYFPGTTLSTNVAGLTFTLDYPSTPTLARLVTWSLTLTDQQVSQVVAGSASPRAPGQPK